MALLLAAACNKKKPSIEVFDDSGVPPELVRVTVNGEQVEAPPAAPGEDGGGAFTGRPRILLPDEHAQVKVTYRSPCGTEIDSGLRYRSASIVLEAEKRVSTTQVLVDNRGRPATKLSIGEATFAVPADKVSRVYLAGWTCGPRAIRIDGTEVGNVGVENDLGERSSLFLDPGGTRCYTVKRAVYDSPGAVAQPFQLELKGRKVYVTPYIRYVFEDLPSSDTAPGTRYNIKEC